MDHGSSWIAQGWELRWNRRLWLQKNMESVTVLRGFSSNIFGRFWEQQVLKTDWQWLIDARNRCENSTIDPIATQKYCRRGSTWDVSLPPLPVYHILYHIPVRWAHHKNPDVQIQPGCLSEATWRYEKKVLIYALSLTFENIWEALPYFMVNIALFYIVIDIHRHSPVIVIVVSPQVCQDIHPSRSRHPASVDIAHIRYPPVNKL